MNRGQANREGGAPTFRAHAVKPCPGREPFLLLLACSPLPFLSLCPPTAPSLVTIPHSLLCRSPALLQPSSPAFIAIAWPRPSFARAARSYPPPPCAHDRQAHHALPPPPSPLPPRSSTSSNTEQLLSVSTVRRLLRGHSVVAPSLGCFPLWNSSLRATATYNTRYTNSPSQALATSP